VTLTNSGYVYRCRLCDKPPCTSTTEMVKHLKCHNNGRPFSCSRCSYTTVWRYEWKSHKLKCEDSSDQLCQLCGMLCQGRIGMKKHIAVAHGKIWRCPRQGCSFASVYRRALTKHLNEKHASEKSFVCKICGLQTRHKSSLFKHELKHLKQDLPSECSICGEHFEDVKSAKDHIAVFHRRPGKKVCTKTKVKPVKRTQTDKLKMTSNLLSLGGKQVIKGEKENFQKIKINKEGISTVDENNKIQPIMLNTKDTTSGSTTIQVAVQIGEIQRTVSLDTFLPSSTFTKTHQISTTNFQSVRNVEHKQVLPHKRKIKDSLIESAPNPSEILEMATDIISRESCQSSIPDNLMNPSVDTDSMPLDQVQELLENQVSSQKERNPMLSVTSKDLGDTDTSLIDESLFDLMSDFPRPSNQNRCQSASTLMFTSFFPDLDLADRPLTPDFFTDSPSAGSFFPSVLHVPSKSLDADSLPMPGYENPHEGASRSSQTLKSSQVASPLSHSFLPIPPSSSIVNMPDPLMQTPDKVLGGPMSFSSTQGLSAFTPITQTPCRFQQTEYPQADQYSRTEQYSQSDEYPVYDNQYSREQQEAVDSISDESPFPMDSII